MWGPLLVCSGSSIGTSNGPTSAKGGEVRYKKADS